MSKVLDKIKNEIHLILLFAVIFNIIALSPLLGGKEPYGNDNSYHLASIIFLKETIHKDPLNALDSWCNYWSMGFPIAHYYHFFSWLVVALISAALPFIPCYTLFNLSIVLLFSLFPCSVYRGLRLMGFNRIIALFSALISTTVQTSLSYGMVLSAYLGYGVYAQLWAMTVFPLTIGCIYRSLTERRGYLASSALLALTFIFNSIIGFIAAITAVIFVFQQMDLLNFRIRPELRVQAKIFFIILMLSVILISFWAIPMALNHDFNGGAPFESKEMMDSFGYSKVVNALTTGRLLDNNRKLPILSILLLIGLGFSISRNEAMYRMILVNFIVWLFIFFGLSTVFQLLRSIVLIKMMPFSRAIFGVQYFAIVLGGIGLYEFLNLRKIDSGTLSINTILLRSIIIMTCFIFFFTWRFSTVRNQAKTLADFRNEENYREELLKCYNFVDGLPDGRIHIHNRTGHGSHWALGLTPAYTHKPVLVGYSSAAGLESLNFYYQEACCSTSKKYYDMYNLRYIIADRNRKMPPFAKKIYTSGPFVVYEVDTRGYFDLVEADILLIGVPVAVRPVVTAWFKSRLPENKKFMVIAKDMQRNKEFENFIIPNKTGEVGTLRLKSNVDSEKISQPFSIFSRYKPPEVRRPLGSVIKEERGINIYSAEVDVKKPSYLLARTTYHPNWVVFVDGVKSDKVMLAPAFIGVGLEEGKHLVEFRYRSGWLKWCMFLSALSLFLFLCIKKHRDQILNKIFFETPRIGNAIFAAIALLAISLLWFISLGQQSTMGKPETGEAYLSTYHPYGIEPGVYYLSNLKPISAKQDDGVLGFDKTFQSNIISLGGVAYEKGLGTQSNSEVIYGAEDFSEFKAVIGLDDELDGLHPNYASAVFEVYLDNRLVFKSDVFYQDTPPKEIRIPLEGAKRIKLVVTDAGQGSPDGNLIWGDHADWADAKFVKAK